MTPSPTTRNWRQLWALATLALAVAGLALNDHLLKGSGLLPGWVTGKISDFCGLVVAPLTSIWLLRAHGGRARRWLAFLLPVPFFVAVKVSPWCAQALVGALGRTGLSWSIRPDPSDLLALVVLPLAWKLAGWLGEPPRRFPRSLRTARAALAAAGALASIASGEAARYHVQAYVVNGADGPVEVEVGYLEGVDCATPRPFAVGILRHGDFRSRTRYTLAPLEVLALTHTGDLDCGPARVTVDSQTVGIAWAADLPVRALKPSVSRDDLRDPAQIALVERSGETLSLRLGPGLVRLDITNDEAPLPASDCQQATAPRLEYSGDLCCYTARIVDEQDIGNGCFRLGLIVDDGGQSDGGQGQDGGAATGARAIYLCLPRSELPFAIGDVVQVGGRDLYQSSNDLRLDLVRVSPDLSIPLPGFAATPSACRQVREPCGAIWEALDVEALGVPLVVGRWTEIPNAFQNGDGGQNLVHRRLTVYLMRAMRTLLPAPACDPAFQRAGIALEEMAKVQP